MSRFDIEDRRGSAALDRAMADPLSFRPMLPKRGGDRVVLVKGRNSAPYTADPARDARPRPGETGFVAIITWRSYFMGGNDEDGTKRDVLAANDVMLDFDRRLFQSNGVEQLPQSGDIFELTAEDGHTITVQQSRECYDDGGVRIVVYCIAPEG